MTSVKAFVGRRRLASSIGGTTRSNTVSARASMRAIIREYERFVKHVGGETPQVLYEALLPVFDLSQVYVPKDTGALESSGYIEKTTFRGKPTVSIGYGAGGEPDYAATVHENLEYRHEAPTRAKYLESALLEEEEKVQARLIQLLKHAGGVK